MTRISGAAAACRLVVLVAGFGLLLSLAPQAASGAGPSQVDARDWDVARAERLRLEAEVRAMRAAKAADPRRLGQVNERLVREQTGFGTRHPPLPADVVGQRREQARIDAMQARMEQARREGRLEQLAGELATTAKGGATVAMRLRAPTQGYPAGGYAYVYQGSSYLGYATIAADGGLSLPVAAGETVDLFVSPWPPFAIQGITGVEAVAGGELAIEDAERVPVDIDTGEVPGYAGAITGQFSLRLGPYSFGFQRDADTSVPGEPAFLLAPSQSYGLQLRLDVPWLVVDAPSQVDGTTASIAATATRGFVFEGRLEDPEGLLSGCWLNRYGEAREPVLAGSASGAVLSEAEWFEVAGQQRFRVAVPRGGPVSLALQFGGSASACQVEDWGLHAVRFRHDLVERIVLSERPRPQVTVRTPPGDPVSWQYGYFHELEPPYAVSSMSFGSDNAWLSLRAGRQYDLEIVASDGLAGAWTRVTAQPGSFPVEVVAEPTANIAVTIDAGSGSSMQGLLEARRDGVLEAAMELYSGREMTLRLPPGDWDFRLTGLAGWRQVPGTGETRAVVLRPMHFERSIVAGSQRIDIELPQPATGVRFDLSDADTAVHATVLDGLEPVGAIAMNWWWTGLYTDIPAPKLRLRGPGLDDVLVSISPSAALPVVDFPALGTGGRLRGTLRDVDGSPLPQALVYLGGEHGTFLYGYYTDAAGRFDLPKVRNAVYWFSAPPSGNGLAAQRKVGAPGGDSVGDIRLQAASFTGGAPGGPELKLIHGTGDRGFRVVFLAEGYTDIAESFTDLNGNGVWDGVLFLDGNGDGLWQNGEPLTTYGEREYPWSDEGTDVSAANEPFVDANGDGYPNIDDRAVFEHNARNYVRALLASPEIRSGIAFDAFVLFTPSNQAGVDVYDAGGQLESARDTRFGASYERGRSLLQVDYGAVQEFLASRLDRWDVQVVMINQPVVVGRANSYILANGGPGAASPNDFVAGHEFGHNPGGLLDEYDEFGGTNLGYVSPRYGHVWSEPDDLGSPWADLLDDRLDVPVAVPGSHGVGLYAGGLYNAAGAYRSTSNSRMRYNAPEFNEASLRVLARSLCVASLDQEALSLRLRELDQPIFVSGFDPPYAPVDTGCDD